MHSFAGPDAVAAEQGERTTLIVAYALDLIAPFTGFLIAIVSVIISHIKAGETQNHFIRSHHRCRACKRYDDRCDGGRFGAGQGARRDAW
jgi:uncharacterized membrane protein